MKNMLNSDPASKVGNVPTKASVPAPSKGKAGFGSQGQAAIGAQPAGGQKSARSGPLPTTGTKTVPAMAPRGAPAGSAPPSKASGNATSGLDTAVSNHADQMHKPRGPRTTGY